MLGVYCARHSKEGDAFAQFCFRVFCFEGNLEFSMLFMGALAIRCGSVSLTYLTSMTVISAGLAVLYLLPCLSGCCFLYKRMSGFEPQFRNSS